MACGALAASIAEAETAAEREQKAGRARYVQYCALCHGDGGRGDGPSAAGFATKPADLKALLDGLGGHFPSGFNALFCDAHVVGMRQADLQVNLFYALPQ